MPEIFDSKHKSKNKVIDVPNSDEKHTSIHKSEVGEKHTKAKSHAMNRQVTDYSPTLARENPARNPFAAFAPLPAKTKFDSQHNEEEILLLLRQHPITQVGWIIVTIILLLLPALFSYVHFLDFLPARFHFVAALGWYLFTFGFALESFLDWFYNVYIITDERIIDVDFHSILFKNISATKIENIEDVSAETKGASSTIFDYGDVIIQTAGPIPEFEFESVPYPTKVTSFINDLIVEEEREKIEGRVN